MRGVSRVSLAAQNTGAGLLDDLENDRLDLTSRLNNENIKMFVKYCKICGVTAYVGTT